jgi:putative phosphoserine phosphatase/1-acylglycerol-3-phosphate O-acyltransferase
VIPIGIWGTEQVWPRSSRLPNILNLTDPPTVRVRVGKPVSLRLQDPASDTKRIMTAITKLLPAEARRRHEPSPEELARTYPPGKSPEHSTTDEHTRRPGTD